MRRKFVSILLLLSLSVTLIFASGCDIADDIRSRIAEKIVVTDPVSAQEMVRLITEAVNDKEKLAESFSGIPEIQRQNVSFSTFTEYVDILRVLSSQNGSVVSSFRILGQEECERVFLEYDMNEEFTYMGCAQFLYEDGAGIPVYIFYDKDSAGISYLSDTWIKGYISIYNYAEHYFNMLSSKNTDGLFTLIKPGFDSDLYSDAAIYNCARSLSDYYELKVKSPMSSYRYMELSPSRLRVVIPETISNDNSSVVEHEVLITSVNGGESYAVNDYAPLYTDSLLIYVFRNGSRIIQCGNTYTDSIMRNLLGEPVSSVIGDEIFGSRVNNYGYIDYKKRVVLIYNDLVLTFDAYVSDSSWEGKLVGIRINSSEDYYTGNNIRVGMTAQELVEIYPYIDKYGYELTYYGALANYNIEIILDDNDVVSMIKIRED